MYWDGNIIMGDDGYDYCGDRSAMLSDSCKLKFTNLAMGIVWTISLVEGHEFIERIIFRKPKLSRGVLNWRYMELRNDDDVSIMFNFIE